MALAFTHDVPAARVIFAAGSTASLGSEVERLGATRALLVAGELEAELEALLGQQLGAVLTERFTDVVMHVPKEIADEATALARAVKADVLVAVGGGSSIGMAKAIALTTGIPILAVPTTYAGSEMTPIWGLTQNGEKVTGRNLNVLPKTVVYDPELTRSLPVDLSMASGMNAIAHLIEGLYAPNVSPISTMQAQEGVRALTAALPEVAREPMNLQARSEALYGAWLAGWTLGTTGMGIHHKICHVLGGMFNLPHAQTHSAVLAYATAFNEEAAPVAMSQLREAFAQGGVQEASAAASVWSLANAIGAPTSLSDVGFREDDVEVAARAVVAANPVNPRPVEYEAVRELLEAACQGGKPTL